MARLILASQSPRRRELLTLLGLPFESIATDIDETPRPDEPPEAYVRRLSRAKALAAAQPAGADAIIVACDTTVAEGEVILGKPTTAAEAATMLKRLRNKTHVAITAVTIVDTASGRAITQAAVSPVTMRGYSDEEIAAYIESGDPFDKAGAYAIQHANFHPVEAFDHCFANVMGLPLCHITRMLRQMAIDPPANVPIRCQHRIQFDCTVFDSILANSD
jgi:nucleoside triphosphate pyrophosphatase